MTDETAMRLIAAIDRLADVLAGEVTKKEREKESPPPCPPKGKGEEKNTHTSRARARVSFTPPTLAECTAYAAEKRLSIDVPHFHDHFASNGWKVSGRAPMRDWRAAMRNWARRDMSVRPLTAYERKRAEFELQEEAAAARKEASRRSAIAALSERDWALCRESGCRHCAGSGCSRGIALPPDHRLNPRPCRPEECPGFSAKGGAA